MEKCKEICVQGQAIQPVKVRAQGSSIEHCQDRGSIISFISTAMTGGRGRGLCSISTRPRDLDSCSLISLRLKSLQAQLISTFFKKIYLVYAYLTLVIMIGTLLQFRLALTKAKPKPLSKNSKWQSQGTWPYTTAYTMFKMLITYGLRSTTMYTTIAYYYTGLVFDSSRFDSNL